MNIPPSKKGEMIVMGASKISLERIKKYESNFDVMARVESWGAGEVAPKGALQCVVDEATFALPLAGLVDLDAEKTRLSKEMDKIQAEIEKINKKLGNANFVERAPEAVVQEQKDRLAGFEIELEKLKAARDNLTST